jgi:polyhydroxybutyrate depolymerase
VLVAAAALVLTGIAVIEGPTAWRQATGHIEVDSLSQGAVVREYRVYRPPDLIRHPGLVIVLHGADASGLQIERQSGFDAQADRLGWIAAYPDGFEDGWEPFGCCHHNGVDDVAFVAAVIDHLTQSDAVDPNRVYATGISRGGMMAYRLACELSSRLAAIAPVAGNMADSAGNAHNVNCRLDRPVSILAIHGSDDLEIPIGGGPSHLSAEGISYASLADVTEVWRGLDNCSSTSSIVRVGPTVETRWTCAEKTDLETFVIAGAGHSWPGAPIVNPPWGPAAELDASSAIADFFESHTRAAASA